MASVLFLTEQDKRLLQGLLDRERRELANTPGRPGDESREHDEHQAPETYIARTPPGGIPALLEQVGSGIRDEPGWANCYIYQIVEGLIYPVSNLFKKVYNLSHERIGGGRWIPVTRDKYGKWIALVPLPAPSVTDTGTGTGIGTGTGTGADNILVLRQQTCVKGAIVTTCYQIIFPLGTRIETIPC